MKRYAWMLAAPVAIAALAMPCAAQTQMTSPRLGFATNDDITQTGHFRRLQPPCPCPTPVDPSDPTKKTTDPSPTPTPTPDVPNFGGYKSSFGQGTPVSGSASAARWRLPPQVADSAGERSLGDHHDECHSADPARAFRRHPRGGDSGDRVFFDYGHFNRFAISSPTGAVPGFNLNTYTIGVEKTLFDGAASVYVSVPFLYATQNISGQAIDGLGDVNAGFKFLLWQNKDTGSAWSAGLTVSAPTGRDTVATNTLNVTFTGGTQPPVVPNPPPVGTVLPFTVTTTINPTYVQPPPPACGWRIGSSFTSTSASSFRPTIAWRR